MVRDTKQLEANEEADEDIAALDRPGITSSTVVINKFGKLSLKEKLEMGVRIMRRIGVATVLTGAELLGWERLINGMPEEEIPQLRERMRNLGQEWNDTGTTAVEQP